MSEISAEEQRKYWRQDLETEVKFTILHPATRCGVIKNISEGGLCLLVDLQLEKGTIMRLNFDLQVEDEKVYIDAVTKVMWQEKQADKYLTGVKFIA